jgi:hypothetical protein
MKTTVDIQDALFERARQHARALGVPMRALIEEGLRRVLDAEATPAPYQLPDRSAGRSGAPDPLETRSWPELREEIYGGSAP